MNLMSCGPVLWLFWFIWFGFVMAFYLSAIKRWTDPKPLAAVCLLMVVCAVVLAPLVAGVIWQDKRCDTSSVEPSAGIEQKASTK